MSSQCEKSPSASSKSFLAATSCNLLFLENTGWLSKGYLVWKSLISRESIRMISHLWIRARAATHRQPWEMSEGWFLIANMVRWKRSSYPNSALTFSSSTPFVNQLSPWPKSMASILRLWLVGPVAGLNSENTFGYLILGAADT